MALALQSFLSMVTEVMEAIESKKVTMMLDRLIAQEEMVVTIPTEEAVAVETVIKEISEVIDLTEEIGNKELTEEMVEEMEDMMTEMVIEMLEDQEVKEEEKETIITIEMILLTLEVQALIIIREKEDKDVKKIEEDLIMELLATTGLDLEVAIDDEVLTNSLFE